MFEKKVFSHFNFLNSDFSLAFQNQCAIFYMVIHNALIQETLSQNLDLGLSYFSIIQNMKIVRKKIHEKKCLDCMKNKLSP